MRNLRFTFVFNQDEKKMLERLSITNHRSKSDTVRHLIREKAEELDIVKEKQGMIMDESLIVNEDNSQ